MPLSSSCSLNETASKAHFDRLTALATKALGVPVSFVTFLEPDRQVFHGRSVLSGPLVEVYETPLTHSICHLVATRREPLIIDDTRGDALVCMNPVVEGAKVHAYAGVPLIDPNGEAVGAFCAIDYKPHSWTPQDVEILHTLAAQVMSELTMRASMAQLREEVASLHQSHTHRSLSHREDRHDLRTPLNAMLLGIQAVRLMGDLNEEQAEYLSLAESSGEALSAVINQMVDIGNIESLGTSALHLSSVQPLQLLSLALEQTAVLARHKKISTVRQCQVLKLVSLDRDKMVRVLVNLVGNAIKFTPEGGQVTVSVDLDHSNAASPVLRFVVEDNGIGIAAENIAKVFQDGFRVDKASPSQHSTGLGLTFCKRVIEAHGGHIWVQSVKGGGTKFTFTLPQPA